MPRVEITLSADDFRIFEVNLTDQEYKGLLKVQEAYFKEGTGVTSGPYCPGFRILNIDEAEARIAQEKKEKAERERIEREQEAKRRKEEHEKDVRENGAFAMAFRKAMEKKTRKDGAA